MSAIVKDVMTANVVAVREDASFKEMAARLRHHRISAFPVVDGGGKVIGVVSEADMLTKEALLASAGLEPGPISHLRHRREFNKAGAMTAGDLMTSPPVTISPEEPVTRAARLMYTCKVKRLPVVDAQNHLVGIVSRADVLSVYTRPDADIESEIRSRVILEMFLADPGRFTITVKNGIVTIEGSPETPSAGHAIVVEIWHVEGVVAVRDRLDYPLAAPVAGPGLTF